MKLKQIVDMLCRFVVVYNIFIAKRDVVVLSAELELSGQKNRTAWRLLFGMCIFYGLVQFVSKAFFQRFSPSRFFSDI